MTNDPCRICGDEDRAEVETAMLVLSRFTEAELGQHASRCGIATRLAGTFMPAEELAEMRRLAEVLRARG